LVYTLGEAAKAVGKSKATLSKAIKSGRISAHKNGDGSFSIDPAELHRVYPPTPSETVSLEHKETPEANGVNTRELIELRIKLKAAEQRISDLEEDRDLWRQQASRLLTHTPQTPPSLWQRLFGK
jgi:excisionase family DNA binding protein